jgi:putative endonuclease
MSYYVYIITNKPNGILYTGVTNDIARRMYEHREKVVEGFSSKYSLTRLVYVEEYPTAAEAIHREKCIKAWKRAWKVKRILEINPEWRDLYEDLNN